ncbi:hypothetical protein SVIOM342S_10582 [Streptomyces violaceorubidus]
MSNTPMAASPLTRAVLEIDEYVSGLGWDQPARLFALVDTARLKADQPSSRTGSVCRTSRRPPA